MPAFFIDYFMLFVQWFIVWLGMHNMTIGPPDTVISTYMQMIQAVQDIAAQSAAQAAVGGL